MSVSDNIPFQWLCSTAEIIWRPFNNLPAPRKRGFGTKKLFCFQTLETVCQGEKGRKGNHRTETGKPRSRYALTQWSSQWSSIRTGGGVFWRKKKIDLNGTSVRAHLYKKEYYGRLTKKANWKGVVSWWWNGGQTTAAGFQQKPPLVERLIRTSEREREVGGRNAHFLSFLPSQSADQ